MAVELCTLGPKSEKKDDMQSSSGKCYSINSSYCRCSSLMQKFFLFDLINTHLSLLTS